MADDNRPLKYMRYAVGEIALVVIGILIALSINNWNEKRKAKVTEIEILNDLLSGLENDKWTLDYIYDKHNRGNHACEIILQIMRDVKGTNKLKGEQFAAVNYVTNFYPTKGAYESLQTIGLNIITNKDLRFRTINLYESWYLVLQTNLEKHAEIILESFSFYQDHFDKFSIIKKDSSIVGISYHGVMNPIDMDSLMKSQRYKFRVNSSNESHQAQLGLIIALQKRVDKLIDDIKKEILLLS